MRKLISTTHIASVLALGLLGGCADQNLDTGAMHDEVSSMDMHGLPAGHVFRITTETVETDKASGEPVDIIKIDPSDFDTISCVIEPLPWAPPGYLIQDGPNCWKFAWINANFALDGSFPSTEKLGEYDTCLTKVGLDPNQGLPNTPEALAKADDCKKKITATGGTGYSGKTVKITRYSTWDEYARSHSSTASTGSGTDSGSSAGVAWGSESGMLDTDGSSSGTDMSARIDVEEVEAEETSDKVGVMNIWAYELVYRLDADGNPILDKEGKPIRYLRKVGHVITLTELPTKANGWTFKGVDPNGGEVNGQVKDRKITGSGTSYDGWGISGIAVESN
jgi:hypothetical protein